MKFDVMNRRYLLVLTSLAILFFALFPRLDLHLQAWLHTEEQGFFMKNHALVELFYHGVEWATGGAILLALIVLLGSHFSTENWLLKQRRNAAFFLLAVALGPGLIVNGLFKEHWGRARPAQVTEFGGEQQYTPPLQITDQCQSNCSFSSGHASMGFVFLAFGFLFPRRRRFWFTIGVALGLAVGMGRMMQGRHFFSDVVFSGLFVSMSTAWLHHMFVHWTQSGNTTKRYAALFSAAFYPPSRVEKPRMRAET